MCENKLIIIKNVNLRLSIRPNLNVISLKKYSPPVSVRLDYNEYKFCFSFSEFRFRKLAKLITTKRQKRPFLNLTKHLTSKNFHFCVFLYFCVFSIILNLNIKPAN